MTVDGKEKILVEGEPPSRHPILYYGAEIFTLAAFLCFSCQREATGLGRDGESGSIKKRDKTMPRAVPSK